MITIDFEKSKLNPEQAAKVKAAVEVANKVTSGAAIGVAFKSVIFRETNGDTNEQILEKVKAPITVKVWPFKSWKWFSKVVAYVNGRKDSVIHFNVKFLNANTIGEVANTLVHESLHLKGYGHAIKPYVNTVPYRVGGIVEDLAVKAKLV